MTPIELFSAIEKVAPSFRSVAAEHIADNGELLPHLLMADLLRYIGSHFEPSNTNKGPTKQELLAVLELLDTATVSATEETKNAIAVSFCEHIETEPFFSGLRPLLGLGLRRHIRAFNEFYAAR
jgi:hypothetical protein